MKPLISQETYYSCWFVRIPQSPISSNFHKHVGFRFGTVSSCILLLWMVDGGGLCHDGYERNAAVRKIKAHKTSFRDRTVRLSVRALGLDGRVGGGVPHAAAAAL